MSTLPTPAPVLVLDSNILGFEPAEALEGLVDRGFVLRVSEVAFYERLAASLRKHAEEGWPLEAARDIFLKRARGVAPHLDPTVPIALCGANLTRRVAAQADGRPLVEKDERFAAGLISLWRRAAAGETDDKTWQYAGTNARDMLDSWDAAYFALCNDAEVQIGDVQWKHVPEDRLRAELREMMHEFSDAAMERLDAQLCSGAYRVHQAKSGARAPKKNDGADLVLPIHIGEGSFLLTRDQKLIDLIAESRTYQRPWVRRPDDLDDLPDGLPWGEYARNVNRTFRGVRG